MEYALRVGVKTLLLLVFQIVLVKRIPDSCG
jgi:hypothetical protein